MELERLVRDLKADIGREALCHRNEARRLGLARVEPPCGFVKKRSRRLELRRHIRQAELQSLELIDGFSESLALRRISESAIKSGLRPADRAGRNVQPAAIEPSHRNTEAFALLAKPIARGDAAILKDDLSRWLGIPAHLAFVLAETEPGR